jgi:uncharacterized protein (TIGR02266 family)
VTTINPVRIRLRYPDLETFVQKFAPNVTRGGVFLASRNIQAVGAAISFEIQLASGEVVLAGQGKVSWVKEFNPAEPNRPYGMGVQFTSLESATKPILARVLRAKEAGAQATRPVTGDAAAGAMSPGATGALGASNGKAAAPPVDTSVDLAAEFGVEDTAVRRVIDRTWMSGARGADDLADLMKPDPIEPVTLAQALVELPRLLDPQFSRRRASGGLRPPDAVPVGNVAVHAGAIANPMRTAGAITGPPPATGSADETTSRSVEASDTTDMTDGGDPADSMSIPAAVSGPGLSGNGRRARKRRG